jgi:hypothetical protein
MPFSQGTIRDSSGNGNHATNTGCHWGGDGQRDAVSFAGTDVLSVPDDPSIRLTIGTAFVSGKNFHIQSIAGRILSKRVAGPTTNYEFRASAANILLYDGTNTRSAVFAPDVSTRSFAVTFQDGEVADLYKDGAWESVFNGVSDITTNEFPLLIGNVSGGSAPTPWDLDGVLLYDQLLTAAEIALIHTWSQSRFTPRKQWPGGGLAVSNPKYIDNIQTAQVTFVNATAGLLSNTGLTVTSGTWAVGEDATGKYLSCVAAGDLDYLLPDADTFTTDAFVEEGGATLAKAATGFTITGGNGDIIRAVRLTA